MGTHLRVLSATYPMATNMIGLRLFSKIFNSDIMHTLQTLDESSLSIGRVEHRGTLKKSTNRIGYPVHVPTGRANDLTIRCTDVALLEPMIIS